MCFWFMPSSPPIAGSNDGHPNGSFDAQLECLMKDYQDAIRLQSSIKAHIHLLLQEREADVIRREKEAKEALRKLEEEKEATRNANVLIKERMNQAELRRDNGENEIWGKEKRAISKARMKQEEAKILLRWRQPGIFDYEEEQEERCAEERRADWYQIVREDAKGLTGVVADGEIGKYIAEQALLVSLRQPEASERGEKT
ncbi:hypothetical protein CPB86DRAFT_877895 [Serendipita vermifera]|nr:hypothetical protein CPB86DRAFT_877895 [Serendipita vermifera]